MAKISTLYLLGCLRDPQQVTPQQLLINAVDGAISDARERLACMEQGGNAGSAAHLDLLGKVGKWEEAKRRNR